MVPGVEPTGCQGRRVAIYSSQEFGIKTRGTAEEPAEYEICDDGETAVFDYYERNTYDDQDEFYLGDKLVAWIKCPEYRVDREVLKG